MKGFKGLDKLQNDQTLLNHDLSIEKSKQRIISKLKPSVVKTSPRRLRNTHQSLSPVISIINHNNNMMNKTLNDYVNARRELESDTFNRLRKSTPHLDDMMNRAADLKSKIHKTETKVKAVMK